MNRHRRRPGGCSRTGIITILAFLAALLLPASTAAALDLERRIHKTILDNGITLLVMERPVSPTVSFYIRHRAGAVDEQSGFTGAAHLLEHMMFKGTRTIGTRDFEAESQLRCRIDELRRTMKTLAACGESKPDAIAALEEEIHRLEEEKRSYILSNDIDRLYREQGGVGLNASTGHDMTTYMVSLPSHAVELWARIESDRLMNPVFREFIEERNVVIEERRQMIDSRPERRLMELFLAAAFVAHPYGRPVIGWPSDIPGIHRDHLSHFMETRYRSSGMVIAVVGDVSAEETASLVRTYFGPLEHDVCPRLEVSPVTEEPRQQGERRTTLTADASPRIMIGFHKSAAPSREDALFDVIETILARGRSSRLYRSLVTEKRVAASVSASNGVPGARYDNLFVISAEPLEGTGLHELEAAVYGILEELRQAPVSDRELEKAKNRIRTDYLQRFDSNSSIASLLSYVEALTGDYREITAYLERIDSITAQEIMTAAAFRFRPENRTVATLIRDENP